LTWFIAEHAIVDADPSTSFDAARTLDLLTVRTPLLVASIWIRGLPARWVGRAAPPLPQLVATGGPPGWLVLGERPGREIAFGADLEGIDAVAGAGALYANRWHRDARRFVRRNTAALRELPVWLVSSGPLSDSAEHQEIPPARQVAKLAKRVGARGHVTFGGRLSRNSTDTLPQLWPKTTRTTGATKPTSGVGLNHWWPQSSPGTPRALKPVTMADCEG
jgi:Flavodoxin domain